MKTKLLRKIRKQYSIVYYPNGQEPSDVYRTHEYPHYYVSNGVRGTIKDTKEACIEWVLDRVRQEYKQYSRRYKKPNYKGIKVWYTKTP